MCNVKALSRVLFLAFLMAGLCQGEIYKWVDENGKVHFSQTPPNDEAEKIDVGNSSEALPATNNNVDQIPSSVDNQKRYSDYLEQERLERKEKREAKKQKKAELRSKCHNARAELSDMNQGGILYYELDENGERKFVEDKRVEAKKDQLRNYLKRNCGGT